LHSIIVGRLLEPIDDLTMRDVFARIGRILSAVE